MAEEQIPRRLYLFVNRAADDTIYKGATHSLAEAQSHADLGALVVEYGKVGLIRPKPEAVH